MPVTGNPQIQSIRIIAASEAIARAALPLSKTCRSSSIAVVGPGGA